MSVGVSVLPERGLVVALHSMIKSSMFDGSSGCVGALAVDDGRWSTTYDGEDRRKGCCCRWIVGGEGAGASEWMGRWIDGWVVVLPQGTHKHTVEK